MIVLRRNNQKAILLQNGQVLLAGGYFETVEKSAELYDPETNTFSITDSMETPREQFAATLLSDGSVLATGGYDGNGATKKAELYVPDTPTSIRIKDKKINNQNVPDFFTLSQNFPNPFNPVTQFNYTLARPANVRITVYNIRGEFIKKLIDAEHTAGQYSVTWNGKSENGTPVGTGMYLVRMESENSMLYRKVLYLK